MILSFGMASLRMLSLSLCRLYPITLVTTVYMQNEVQPAQAKLEHCLKPSLTCTFAWPAGVQ